MGRFADINRGPELAKAYDALQDWRKLTKAEKKTRYNAVKKTTARVKPERVIAYIVPFSAARPDIFLQTQVPAPTQTETGDAVAAIVRTLIATRFVTATPTAANDTIIKPPRGFSFAKVRATRNVGTPNVNAVSRLTGTPYTRISTESMSGNFGQVAGATNFEAASKAIKAITDYATFNNAPGQSIAIIPERG